MTGLFKYKQLRQKTWKHKRNNKLFTKINSCWSAKGNKLHLSSWHASWRRTLKLSHVFLSVIHHSGRHKPRNTDAPSPSHPSNENPIDTRFSDVQELIVDTLNQYRRSVQAANMLKVSWDNVAAASAQAYIDQCDFHTTDREGASKGSSKFVLHNSCFQCGMRVHRLRESRPIYAFLLAFQKCGQNLALGNGFKTWLDVLEMWNDQGQNFRYGRNPCNNGKPYRAYTQVESVVLVIFYLRYLLFEKVNVCPV